MPYSTAARNRMVDSVGSVALFASLHSAYPGDTGTSEISGGVPPYARQAIAWASSSGGSAASIVNPTFNVPAATTIQFMGLWSALTAGTFYGSIPLAGTAGTPFYAAASSDIFSSDGHGLADGDRVIVMDTNVGVLPTGVVEGTVYFVRDTSGDTFKLTATSGGTAIDLTADGTGFISKIVPETFGSQGTYAVSSASLNALR